MVSRRINLGQSHFTCACVRLGIKRPSEALKHEAMRCLLTSPLNVHITYSSLFIFVLGTTISNFTVELPMYESSTS